MLLIRHQAPPQRDNIDEAHAPSLGQRAPDRASAEQPNAPAEDVEVLEEVEAVDKQAGLCSWRWPSRFLAVDKQALSAHMDSTKPSPTGE
jgi:hypothetical protein